MGRGKGRFVTDSVFYFVGDSCMFGGDYWSAVDVCLVYLGIDTMRRRWWFPSFPSQDGGITNIADDWRCYCNGIG